MRYGREKCCAAPDQGADDHDAASLEPVGQGTDERRGAHIAPDEGGRQEAKLGIGTVELGLYERLYREQHRTVDIVDEVQGREDEQGPTSAAVAHAWEDYKSGGAKLPV